MNNTNKRYDFFDNMTGEKLASKVLVSFEDAVKQAERLEMTHDTSVRIYG